MTQVFKNNAYGSLAAELSATGTLLSLASGQGARFPLPAAGDFFLATLILLDGNGAESAWEVVKCTARATDGLTIVRAQEGTTARIWPAGSRLELRVTAGTLDSFTDTAQAAAAAPVQSVAGKIGAVTLAKGDVGLGNVDNTSDANKPVSTATQTALNLKVDKAGDTFSGLIRTPSGAASASIVTLPDGAQAVEVFAQGTGPTAGPAVITFHRPASHATHFGLDTDNKLKVGGWSLGANAYAIYHEGNKPAKADVGLANVDNTADLAKPISTATQAALDTKQPIDADLTAIAALTGTTGLLKKTAADTWTLDTTSYQPTLVSNTHIKTFNGDSILGSGELVAAASHPVVRPSLILDFANSQSVDPRITFNRASTATRTNRLGQVEVVASNVHRIDYDPFTGECRGLLIEESRTNIIKQSGQIDGTGAWTKGQNIVVAGNATAPDGTNTATVLQYSQVGNAFMVQFPIIEAGATYAASVWLRLRSGTFDGGGAIIIFDDQINVITHLYASQQTIDGVWRRYSMVVKNTGGNGTGNMYVAADFSPGVELEVWGAQLEKGAFATSYIPTTTTEITRAADIPYIPQDRLGFMRPNSGTIKADYSIAGFRKTTVAEQSVVTVGLSGGNYGVRLRSYSNGAGYYDSDTLVMYPGYAFDGGGIDKNAVNIKTSSACSYGRSGVISAIDGQDKGANLTAFNPASHSVIALGHFYNASFLNGHLQRVEYYPAEMSVGQLKAITAP